MLAVQPIRSFWVTGVTVNGYADQVAGHRLITDIGQLTADDRTEDAIVVGQAGVFVLNYESRVEG
jgi:hypothetical protein